MKTIYGIAIAAVAACALSACKITKDGEMLTKKIDVSAFNKIECNGIFDVVYTPGDYRISLELRENVLDKIDISTKDSVLVLNMKEGSSLLRLGDDMKVTVICSSPDLKALNVNGSGDMKLSNINERNFSLLCNGAGDIEWENCSVGTLTAAINGSGDMNILKGKVDVMTLSVSGSGDITADDLIAGKLHARISGAGDIDLRKCDIRDLSVSCEGSGDISVSGNVEKGLIFPSGIGSVSLDVKDPSKVKIVNR